MATLVIREKPEQAFPELAEPSSAEERNARDHAERDLSDLRRGCKVRRAVQVRRSWVESLVVYGE